MQVTEHVHALCIDYSIRVSPTMCVKRFVYVYFIVGQEVSNVLNRCGQNLQAIHETIREELTSLETIDSMALCQAVFARLKLPTVAVNPLVAQSLMSHVPYLGQPDITA